VETVGKANKRLVVVITAKYVDILSEATFERQERVQLLLGPLVTAKVVCKGLFGEAACLSVWASGGDCAHCCATYYGAAHVMLLTAVLLTVVLLTVVLFTAVVLFAALLTVVLLTVVLLTAVLLTAVLVAAVLGRQTSLRYSTASTRRARSSRCSSM
jgi:hypothetical protein